MADCLDCGCSFDELTDGNYGRCWACLPPGKEGRPMADLHLRLCPDGGLPTVGQAFTQDDFDVVCGCGFKVEHLSSMEAALDTVKWHMGDSTTPLGEARDPRSES